MKIYSRLENARVSNGLAEINIIDHVAEVDEAVGEIMCRKQPNRFRKTPFEGTPPATVGKPRRRRSAPEVASEAAPAEGGE